MAIDLQQQTDQSPEVFSGRWYTLIADEALFGFDPLDTDVISGIEQDSCPGRLINNSFRNHRHGGIHGF